jgi:predicted nucleic acid-binding protein
MICIDASVAYKLVQYEELSDLAEALLSAATSAQQEIVAPPLLPIEMTNALLKRTRPPTRISLDEARRRLDWFFQIPIDIRNPDGLHDRALSLAHAYGLPAAYDAHYLAPAETLGCDVWTDDRRLLRTLAGRMPFVRALADYDGALR